MTTNPIDHHVRHHGTDLVGIPAEWASDHRIPPIDRRPIVVEWDALLDGDLGAVLVCGPCGGRGEFPGVDGPDPEPPECCQDCEGSGRLFRPYVVGYAATLRPMPGDTAGRVVVGVRDPYAPPLDSSASTPPVEQPAPREMVTPTDGHDPTCPLPVLRVVEDVDDQGSPHERPVLERCDGSLLLHTEAGGQLDATGRVYEVGPWWEVTCEQGHTLVTIDTQASDPHPEHAYRPEHLVAALALIGEPCS